MKKRAGGFVSYQRPRKCYDSFFVNLSKFFACLPLYVTTVLFHSFLLDISLWNYIKFVSTSVRNYVYVKVLSFLLQGIDKGSLYIYLEINILVNNGYFCYSKIKNISCSFKITNECKNLYSL